jgi:hypothetical protein
MNDANEREWEAQELARQAERLGLDPAGDDSHVRPYRLIARALRQPPHLALPEDFAKQVAARVAAAPVTSKSASSRGESVLLAVLVSILIVSAGVVLARGGPSWLPAIRAALWATDPANIRWPLAFVGCIGLSWILWQGQRRVLPHS